MTPAQLSSVLAWAAFSLASLLLLAGAAVYFSLFETLRSRHWVETPCTIAVSQMNRADRARMYWNVYYDYEFEGTQYRGNRFELLHFSSRFWGDIADLVDQYPTGRQAVCFVDPLHPENAVLSRRIRRGVWLTAIPTVMVLVGLGGIAVHLSPRKAEWSWPSLKWEKTQPPPQSAEEEEPPDDPEDLPAKRS
jgi:hypothetical protein